MKGYIFYSKSDPSKEPVNSWTFNSKEEAVEGFAQIKKLPKEQFIKLFIVEAYDGYGSKKEN